MENASTGDSAVVCQTVTGRNSPTVNISLDSTSPSTCAFSPGIGNPYYSSGYPSYPGPSSSSLSSFPSPYSSSSGWPAYQWYQPCQVPEENCPFNLCFISGNITKCAGCGNRYLKPPTPPYDLCVQHREWRSFVPPGSTPQRKFSPAYYHLHLLCIKANWPMFNPQELVITEEMASKLGNEH